jgi:class 3 adenylate cyclase
MFAPSPLKKVLVGWAFMVIGAICSFVLIYVLVTNYREQAISERMRELVRIGVLFVDGDAHQTLKSQEDTDTPAYMEMINPLVKYHNAMPEITYVYTMIMRGKQFYIVLDTAKYAHNGRNKATHSGVMEKYEAFEMAMYETITKGEIVVGGFVADRFGTFKSAYAPIRDSSGAIIGLLGIDLSYQGYIDEIDSVKRFCFYGFLLFAAFVTVIAAFNFLSRRKTIAQIVKGGITFPALTKAAKSLTHKEFFDGIMLADANWFSAKRVLAELRENVSVMFINVLFNVNQQSPESVDALRKLFYELDQLIKQLRLHRIKSMHDDYIVVGGLDTTDTTHCYRLADMALGALAVFTEIQSRLSTTEEFHLQVGIAVGPMMIALLDDEKLVPNVWNETINAANALNKQAPNGRIHCSEAFVKRAEDQFRFEQRGNIGANKSDRTLTYFLIGKQIRRS